MKIAPLKQYNSSFNGYKQIKDEHGYQQYQFNYPFDDRKFDCYLEIYNVEKDNNGYYRITDLVKNTDTKNGEYKLENGKNNNVDLLYSYFIDKDTPFAYHYKLVNKFNPSEIYYKVDAGDVIDERGNTQNSEVYNFVTRNGSKVSRGGSMKLVIPDNYDPRYIYNDKNEIIPVKNFKNKVNIHKNFANKIGGTLAGIENAVRTGDFNGYSSIISLPLFTDDDLTGHGYWNKNCMQIIPSLGNINNYASLQRALFSKGINWVSDGAFVNEGLQGVHFSNLLKWGEKSPYYYWFNASGLENGPFLLGVFGKNSSNIGHKIVNSPYAYTQNDKGDIKISRNKNYDRHKPTYVQIFDKRLTSEFNQTDTTKTFKSYDNLENTNPYKITTHDDTVVNYKFEINPETYHKNVKNLIEYNKIHDDKIKLFDSDGTRFVNKYETFSLENKIESNFKTWDANTDIAQLNYVYSPSDTENNMNLTEKEKYRKNILNRRGNYEAQDYVITSGIYWTQKTKDILTLHTAQQFKNVNSTTDVVKRIKNSAGKTIPSSILENIDKHTIENIINNDYVLPSKLSDENYENQILEGIMNFPLDSIELGDNIVGVLASPYLTKRASVSEDVGVSAYDLYKQGNQNLPDEYKRAYTKMQNIYTNEMLNFAKDVISSIQKNLPPMSENSTATLYGKYVLPLMTQEIAKFAVIKSLYPNAYVTFNQNGEISYKYKELKETSLQDLGIFASSPEDEALTLAQKIKEGIPKISNSDKQLLQNALIKAFEGTNEKSFALADVIIDLTQSGLDWRIDATKDITDINALRNGQSNFAYSWNQVNEFWKNFSSNILKVNPNAYLVAEVTDENELYDQCAGDISKYQKQDIIRQLLNNTGMTATANYNSFFTDVIMAFGKKTEFDAGDMEKPLDFYNAYGLVYKKLINDDYLRTSNLASLLYSYTFIGNHDKPRILHAFALDMQQFFADLTLYDDAGNNGNKINEIQQQNNAYPKYLIDEYRKRAYRVINNRFIGDVSDQEVEDFDFSNVSSKAVAMGEVMMHGFSTAMNDMCKDKNFASKKQKVFESIANSISTLANGKYLNENFNADAFGVNPINVNIDTIIEQARQSDIGLPLNEEEIKTLKENSFNIILRPALTRLLGAMKILNALPGKPTMYHGDDLGETGFESKTKNIYVKNRGYIHNEWKTDKPLINEFYGHFKNVMSLRNRTELDALNNGTPYVLPNMYSGNKVISGLLRQNTDGKMAITLFNLNGLQHNNQVNYSEPTVELSHIDITLENNPAGKENEKIGLIGGLPEHLRFYNANDKNDVYEIKHYDNGKCQLKHVDDSPIKINDTTLILYHTPEHNQPLSFTGNSIYKIQAKSVINAYQRTSFII